MIREYLNLNYWSSAPLQNKLVLFFFKKKWRKLISKNEDYYLFEGLNRPRLINKGVKLLTSINTK